MKKVIGQASRVVMWLLILFALFTAGPLRAGVGTARTQSQAILEEMTPEEKVGQLFLVTFDGARIDPDHEVFDLIVNGHISGVVLRAENDNLIPPPDTLPALRTLIDGLQEMEYESSLQQGETELGEGEDLERTYIPLFIAVEQVGGGLLREDGIPGMTEMPSPMAMGATWNPSLAAQVGEVAGKELEALGVNLMLGPSLDVLHEPRLGGSEGLGIQTYGGDPFWVSELGMAYVGGVHEGSGNRVAVVVKHFPGIGSSDRPPQQEVATIRKSLEELRQIDLPPFFGVTSGAPGESGGIADGLLTSHIRYQGFQGSIRATTRPVSLDGQALATLMDLEPISAWREAGGLVIGDSLGSRAVRRFYDPVESEITSHLVARDAFLAGNDLLILSNFRSAGDPNEVTSITGTLEFFANKYREDPLFATRVDGAVQRILDLKLRMYGGIFSPLRISPQSSLDEVGEGGQATYDVASSSATLIFPAAEELTERLGDPPQLGERVVFFTDDRQVQLCSDCNPHPIIAIDALEGAVQRLYGFQGTGQIGIWTLTSFSAADLAFYLQEEVPEEYPHFFTPPEIFEPAIEGADWLVFLILDESEEIFGSNALSLLLERRPDLAQRKKLVVLDFDVPYDVDATDISKVSAYYALYDRSPPFIDVGARLLFQELAAPGAPPVNVPAIDYDLIEALAPDPEQVIQLRIIGDDEMGTEGAPDGGFGVGDVIHVSTTVIRDQNGNPVPDGTFVRFDLAYQSDPSTITSFESTTVEGVARTDIALDRIGQLTITAQSDPARTSELLQLNVQEGVRAFVTVIAPTAIPTAPAGPTATPPSPTATPTPGVAVEAEVEPPTAVEEEGGYGALQLVLGIIGLGMVAVAGVIARRNWGPMAQVGEVRIVLTAAVAGLLVYNYLALGLPGSQYAEQSLGLMAPILLSAMGAGIGVGLAYVLRGGGRAGGFSAD